MTIIVQPSLSIIVIAYDMVTQLEVTLTSLSASYQQGVDDKDYEVIVVENESSNTLPNRIIESLPHNFSYHRRLEPSQSPVHAINFALEKTRANTIGLIIDGAHAITPGVVKLALDAFKMSANSFVTVPSYHLGAGEQNKTCLQGHNQDVEKQLLKDIHWPHNGYKLFDIGTLCDANPRGFLAPIMESNCYFAPKELFDKIGGADSDFDLPGGGSINLHMTRLLGTHSEVEFYTLAGEGSFHQFHDGTTTSENRQSVVESHYNQLHSKWGGKFEYLSRNPIILGNIAPEVLRHFDFSVQKMIRRNQNCEKNNWPLWPDDK